MEQVKKLTICIPTYERIFGFKEALESVLNQSSFCEIIVSDNSQKTDWFEKECSKHQNVKYYKNKTNLGVFGNWNRCVELCKTEYVAILGSDDLMQRDTCLRVCNEIEENPEVDIIFGPFEYFIEKVDDTVTHGNLPVGRNTGKDVIINTVISKTFAFPTLYFVRASVLRNNPFIVEPHGSNDWLWIFDNIAQLNATGLANSLSLWRKHDQGDHALIKNTTFEIYPYFWMTISRQLVISNPELSSLSWNYARLMLVEQLASEWGFNSYYPKRYRLLNKNDHPCLLDISKNLIPENRELRNLTGNNIFCWLLSYLSVRLKRSIKYRISHLYSK
jgi:glycosyltransferase involved in cell wall biosynthesis